MISEFDAGGESVARNQEAVFLLKDPQPELALNVLGCIRITGEGSCFKIAYDLRKYFFYFSIEVLAAPGCIDEKRILRSG
jgi:hypothetical protein